MNFLRSLTSIISGRMPAQQMSHNMLKPSFNSMLGITILRNGSTLEQLHKTGPIKKYRPSKNPLGFNVPFAKGIVLRTVIRKPKKPNSANRKCVVVRLCTGKELTAYVPGEGHNLQEHNVVLVRPGRTKDVPGLKVKCVRGKYDLPHVMKTTLL